MRSLRWEGIDFTVVSPYGTTKVRSIHTRVDTSENEENKGDVVEPRSILEAPDFQAAQSDLEIKSSQQSSNYIRGKCFDILYCIFFLLVLAF